MLLLYQWEYTDSTIHNFANKIEIYNDDIYPPQGPEVDYNVVWLDEETAIE